MLFEDIPNDLIVNIFIKLPLKSIIRFGSLSKYWHSRIFSQEFIRVHSLQCSKNPQKIIIRHPTYSANLKFKNIYTLHSRDQLLIVPTIFQFPNYPSRFTDIVGSCNGILCIPTNDQLILCNFSVRRKLIVPRHPWLNVSYIKVALGFGFDPITDDYKIVAISYSNHPLIIDQNNTFVYSLKTDSWTRIPSPAVNFFDIGCKACFLNGVLHWVVDCHGLTGASHFILTFNVSSHVFDGILFPRHWGNRRIRQLTTINGCLAVVVSFEGSETWKIAVMKVYCKTESWSVLFELTNGDTLAYCDGSEVYIPQTTSSKKIEMEMYAETLELLDNERAIACEETRISGAKKDIKSQEKSIIARIKRLISYRVNYDF